MPRVTDTKILEKVEKSTLLFLKRGAFCYYSGIDWLTVRFPQTSALYSVLWGLTDNSAVYTFPFGGFKVIYRGILGGKQKLLWIVDEKNNKIGDVRLLPPDYSGIRTISTDLQLDGTFFSFYYDFFDEFLSLFEVDRSASGMVTRLDYCYDIAGVTIDEYLKFKVPKQKGENKRSGKWFTDDVQNAETDSSDRVEVQIYDKKLDITQKEKYKIQDNNGNFPFNRYIKEKFPIVRFECRWWSRAIREGGYSLDYMLENSKQMAFDNIRSYYFLDLYGIEGLKRKKLLKKKDGLVSPILEKKLMFSETMARAYLKNILLLKDEQYLKMWIDDFLNPQKTPEQSFFEVQAKVCISGKSKTKYEFVFNEE